MHDKGAGTDTLPKVMARSQLSLEAARSDKLMEDCCKCLQEKCGARCEKDHECA